MVSPFKKKSSQTLKRLGDKSLFWHEAEKKERRRRLDFQRLERKASKIQDFGRNNYKQQV